MSAVPPVFVGKTPFPLKTPMEPRGPLPLTNVGSSALPWRLLDGPPYANGAPHLGHVLNKHLKDALARAHAALGKKVEWRPGWDCHGLPLELAVERQGGNRADREAFAGLARAYASEQVAVQDTVFQAQGWSAQWDAPWRTMDPAMEAGTLRVLASLLERGALEVRHTAVPWCPSCQSTLSGAEQEEKPVTADTWLAPFALSDGSFLMSWTTTPWTLPLNQGLVVHPNASYRALELGATTLWVSEETAERWAGVLGAEVGQAVCQGKELVGLAYRTPWKGGHVLGSERVLPEAGTGVLHAVSGLAELDTCLGQEFGWEAPDHLTPDGRVQHSPCASQNTTLAGGDLPVAVREGYEGWPGLTVLPQTWQAPHCWRHKAPLLTRRSRQVFLSLSVAMRQRVEGWVETLAFTPESARARLRAAVGSRPDWCLSRQRTWGVPMALFLDKHTGQPHAHAAKWMRRAADRVETQGVEAWWKEPSSTWLQEEADEATVERVDDVLDVWFDSGCVPQLVGAADAVVEGSDQHRGWFQSCLWVAAALGQEEPPFHRVVSHGFVVDAQGQKFSKSTGGDAGAATCKSVAPPLWSTLPTDVVRAWALAGSEGAEKAWTVDTVREAQAVVDRWRGVVRFMVANQLEESTAVALKTLEPWDRWWWLRCQQTAASVVESCSRGFTGEALMQAASFGDEFSSVALGSWKDRLYCADPHSQERQSLDAVVKGCLAAWLQALSVLAPRLVDEVQPYVKPLAANMPENVAVTEVEREEVSRVLEMRQSLAQAAERLSSEKVPPARRCVGWTLAPAWPLSLVADALDVAQVVRDQKGLFETHDPVCPRCRRAQPAWEGLVCMRCSERVGVVN